MVKQNRTLIIILILFVLDRDILTTAASVKQIKTVDNVPYFQASNLKDQIGGLTGKSVVYNSLDGVNRYTVFNNGKVEYKSAGLYFGVYAIQAGSPRGNGDGEIHLWSRQKNGQDEANSNSIQTVRRGTTGVLVYTTFFKQPTGQGSTITFSAIVSEPCVSLGLIATDFITEPVVPSVIGSEIQISSLKNPVNYASLTSSQNQLGTVVAQPVKLDVSGDVSGVDTSSAAIDGSITFTESKLYFAVACGQIARAPSTSANGFVHLWWRMNGVDVADSNTIQSIHEGNTAVLVTQLITTVNPGDKLQIMFSSTDPTLGLIVTSPSNEPVVPSMIFLTFELGIRQDALPYAQFSSSITQSGCLTKTAVKFDKNDGARGITVNNDIVQFSESGTYFIMAAAQVGIISGTGIGDVHLWMGLNGQDMANSNTIQTIKDTDTTVLVSQTIAVLQAGDKLQVLFSADVTKGTFGIIATQPAGEPLVPSVIFSAFKSTSYNTEGAYK